MSLFSSPSEINFILNTSLWCSLCHLTRRCVCSLSLLDPRKVTSKRTISFFLSLLSSLLFSPLLLATQLSHMSDKPLNDTTSIYYNLTQERSICEDRVIAISETGNWGSGRRKGGGERKKREGSCIIIFSYSSSSILFLFSESLIVVFLSTTAENASDNTDTAEQAYDHTRCDDQPQN